MALNVNVSKVWKSVKTASVNVSSTWRHVPQIYINVNGIWKPIWSYSWSIGGWGSCSASCGGGTQTRAVTCIRNDGTVMADSICTKFVGAKPATSQSCNTQSCISCLYNNPNHVVCGTEIGVPQEICNGRTMAYRFDNGTTIFSYGTLNGATVCYGTLESTPNDSCPYYIGTQVHALATSDISTIFFHELCGPF